MIVLILDLTVKFEIFNKDTDESSEVTEVSEARESRKMWWILSTCKDTLPKSLYMNSVLCY